MIKDNNNEIWKTIENFSDYQVSSFGRVKSLKFKKEKILKLGKTKKGYFIVVLCKNGIYKTKNVHVLIYETFYNNKLKLNECVHHKDENKENNYYENLEKISVSKHSSFHNKEKRNHFYRIKNYGEKNSHHKLTEEQVIQIKLLLKEGKLTQQEIANIFGICRSTISLIKNRKIWNCN
jgi:predicted XRE-type DNA-binding protein